MRPPERSVVVVPQDGIGARDAGHARQQRSYRRDAVVVVDKVARVHGQVMRRRGSHLRQLPRQF